MAKKINVMHVLPSLEIGGMENGVVNLVNHLDFDRFESNICCLEGEGPMKNRLNSQQIKIFNMNVGSGIQYRLPLRLAKLFRQQKVDIVHTHNFDSGLYGVLGAKLAGTPVVVYGEHGSFLQNNFRRNQLGRLVCKMTDHIVTMSADLEKRLKVQWCIPVDRASHIVNGIEFEKFSTSLNTNDLKSELGINQKDYVIGTVGRLVPVKDYATLIDCFSLLKNRIQNVCLVFVGDGPLKRSLIDQAQKLDVINDIKFLGTRDDIPELLHIFDVFCLTSLTEGISNTILEAMAAGIPVIATNVGGTPEIIQPDITGILIPPKNKELLVNALERIIQDKELASKLGFQAQQWVQKERSLNRMVQEYSHLYLSLAEKKGVITRH